VATYIKRFSCIEPGAVCPVGDPDFSGGIFPPISTFPPILFIQPKHGATNVIIEIDFGFAFWRATPCQLIDFSAQICDSDPQRMIELITRLGLDMSEIKGRPFNKLSGGEKQKILISIALGRDTGLLVLDEPAANLDPAARQVFFSLLAERQENTSMIISSHRLDEVAALVNRVV